MRYEKWSSVELEDASLAEELGQIKGNDNEINERFGRELDFGTAGLRGILGVGSNRMNIYTVRKATQGLCNYLKQKGKRELKAAIAYDSRINSELFAKETAMVFAANGVTAYLYKELMPTPALSFAVRELGCDTGIVVTASHNPAKYNGYKVYAPDGGQITLDTADAVQKEISQVDCFTDIHTKPFAQGISDGSIRIISDELTQKYLDCVLQQQVNAGVCKDSGLQVVYSPLNGAGLWCVTEVFKRIGLEKVFLVKEQTHPDGNFPTCTYPNPEEKAALELGLSLAEEKKADVLIATDPDCDRVGIAVRHAGEYQLISGNQIGVLLLDYIARMRIKNGTMPHSPIAVKSIVSTALADVVAAYYGIEMINVLTGFKFIGEQIAILEDKGEEERYIFGFEESYGYLSGGYVRDKDAVDGSMLICEMVATYKGEGKTLVDVLEEIYKKHGVYLEKVYSFAFEGMDGMNTMAKIMENLRQNKPHEICGSRVEQYADYASGKRYVGGREENIPLPKSNIVQMVLENGSGIIVRPSGTEPKIKVYLSVVGSDHNKTQQLCQEMKEVMDKFMRIS